MPPYRALDASFKRHPHRGRSRLAQDRIQILNFEQRFMGSLSGNYRKCAVCRNGMKGA
jgi:hypothetical protein